VILLIIVFPVCAPADITAPLINVLETSCAKIATPRSFVSDAINDFDGVYRVSLFRNKQKLAIRFTEESLTQHELVQQLIKLLTGLEKKGKIMGGESLFLRKLVWAGMPKTSFRKNSDSPQPYLPGFLFVVVQNLYLYRPPK
jgi:hypothetical protein